MRWFRRILLLLLAGLLGLLCLVVLGGAVLWVMRSNNLTAKTCTGNGVEQPALLDKGQLPGNILFVSTRDHPAGELYTMRADGTQVRRLTNNDLAEEYPSVSPDGQKVLFSVKGGGLYQLDLPLCLSQPQGCDSTQWTLLRQTGWDPEWSPDGQKILFLDSDVLVMNADGSGVTPLLMRPATPSLVKDPTWGPDSRRVVAVTLQNAVANLDVRSEDHTWWIGKDVYAPDWSPDGSRIVVQDSRQPGLCIIEMTATGEPVGAPHRLLALPAFRPAWSPDSRWIVFSSPQGVGVMDAEGMTMALLTQETDQYPTWYP